MSIYVRNNTASTIPRGRAVYSDGVAGGLPRVALARADAVGTMPCIGITLEAIDPSQNGRVGTDETVTAMDTSGFSVGELLYVSGATAGALTATLPASPNIVQRVGRVMFVSAREGRMSVQVETANFAKDGSFEIAGATPEMRMNETDQSAPAAAWRWRINSKSFDLEWAETAAYATWRNALSITRAGAGSGNDGTAQLLINNLQIGRSSTHVGNLVLVPGTIIRINANSGEVSFNALNSASATTTVAKLASANDPGGGNYPSFQFVNRPLWSEFGLAGWGAIDWVITPNYAGAGTARNMSLALSNAGAEIITQWHRTNTSTPFVSVRAHATVPTTTLLPASFLFFGMNASDQLVAYFNKAGAIISYVIGTLA